MESGKFDTLVMSVGETSSRRRVVRWLAGTAAGMALIPLGMQESEAKKRGRRKGGRKRGRKNQNQNPTPTPQTCTAGTLFQSISVPSTGATVQTKVLASGQRYRLRASGYWVTNPQYGNDAFAAFPFANPNAPEKTYNGVRLGLSVDGGSPDQWGSYNAGHTYEREVTGQGAALSLRFTDPETNDNSGSLSVEIFCA